MPELPLELIQHMLQRVLDAQGGMREDMHEVKTRLGRLEADVAQLHVALAEQSTRMDRFDARMQRIEKRLELVEP